MAWSESIQGSRTMQLHANKMIMTYHAGNNEVFRSQTVSEMTFVAELKETVSRRNSMVTGMIGKFLESVPPSLMITAPSQFHRQTVSESDFP
eukprot:scaffold2366_cov159-Amphora_coffeaeformis.AAC.4